MKPGAWFACFQIDFLQNNNDNVLTINEKFYILLLTGGVIYGNYKFKHPD